MRHAQIHDINPFAVAIARFRLLVAALNAAGTAALKTTSATARTLLQATAFSGAPQQALDDDMLTLGTAVRADATENAPTLRAILHRQITMWSLNPPYITRRRIQH